MSPVLLFSVIVILALLLAAVSAIAGSLWCRVRSQPMADAIHMARALLARRVLLDQLVDHMEVPESLEQADAATSPDETSPLILSQSRADQAESATARGPRLITVPDLSAPPAPAATALAERFSSIWDLADAGASAESIARVTGQPLGQVELVLGLRRQLSQQGRPMPAGSSGAHT